eukprot:scaffold883_cov110-Cylindrotheca_fusiformis.AAC.3
MATVYTAAGKGPRLAPTYDQLNIFFGSERDPWVSLRRNGLSSDIADNIFGSQNLRASLTAGGRRNHDFQNLGAFIAMHK